MSQAISPSPAPSPPPDKNQLLLLGLQLLNKSLKLPCAVVSPQVQAKPPPADKANVVASSPPPKTVVSASPSSEGDAVGRKRKRNVNEDLSEVERREKRKMMNRVAAQNARDRKKQYMEELESKIALLESQNLKLQKENQLLKQQTDTLSMEKMELQKCLETVQSSELSDVTTSVKGLLELPVGSAVPLVSPQQKPVPQALLPVFDVLAQLLSFSEDLACFAPSHHPPGSIDGQPGNGPPENAAMVGLLPGTVEPSKELIAPGSPDQINESADKLLSNTLLDSLTLQATDVTCVPGEPDVEELLMPFTRSIFGTEHGDWDIEQFFAT